MNTKQKKLKKMVTPSGSQQIVPFLSRIYSISNLDVGKNVSEI